MPTSETLTPLTAAREWKHRPTELVRATLKMLCTLVWTKAPPPGAHVWSIPTDPERDFDCILYDVLAERDDLNRRYLALCEGVRALASRLREDAPDRKRYSHTVAALLGDLLPVEDADD